MLPLPVRAAATESIRPVDRTIQEHVIKRCPHTPATLAAEWRCSARHVRNLIELGELRAFRLGGKLLRIPADAVEEFERRNDTVSCGDGA